MHKSLLQIIGLVLLSMLSLTALGASRPGEWFDSPVSPVPPPVYEKTPGIKPNFSPVMPDGSIQPSIPDEKPSRWPVQSVWSSPLPWIAVGLVAFGLLAWALTTLIDRWFARSTKP